MGLLEKHKDYVLRAKNFHRKEDAIRVRVLQFQTCPTSLLKAADWPDGGMRTVYIFTDVIWKRRTTSVLAMQYTL